MPIIAIGFGCFWLMFGAVAWGLSRNGDLSVIGERAFNVVSVVALLIGIFALWSATDLYAGGGRAQGSVVELEAMAGEPMDVLVNGYLIAQGEVVVVNDKFGIRLTDIVTPSERMRRLSRGS